MKRSLLIGLLVLVSGIAAAQSWHRRVPDYPFTRFDRNELQFPGGESRDFDLFLRKLDTLLVTGKGDLRILHIGGSHVQGGTWTGQLRRNLQALRYGMDGGRGLVFPYSAAATNTPSSYYSSYTGEWDNARCLKPDRILGLTGIAVSTADTAATVAIDLAERERSAWSPAYSFKEVDVLGYGELTPVLLMDRDTVRGSYDGRKWTFELPHYTEWIKLAFTGYPGRFTLKGLYLDRPSTGLTLSEAGVNGAATTSFLKCEDFEEDLAVVNPDLVIFSLGINDIQGNEFNPDRFAANYRKLIKAVRRVNPHCAILLTTVNDSWRRKESNPFGELEALALKDIAKAEKAALWDLFEIMGGSGSMALWEEAGLTARDKIHFNGDGYRLVGNLMFNALMQAYEERK